MKTAPSNRTLIAWVASLAFVLILPWAMAKFNLYDRRGAYLTVPASSDTFAYLYQQLYQDDGDLDVVFLGGSLMGAGIDTPQFKERLSSRIGREAKAITLSWNWPGVDLENIIARDLLQHRRVKMVVISFSDEMTEQYFPHPLLPYIMQYDDARELSESLPPFYRLELFSTAMLAAPRQLWMTLRGSDWVPSPKLVKNLGALEAEIGFRGQTFRPNHWHPPALSSSELLYSPARDSRWEFSEKPFGPYERGLWHRLVKRFSDAGVQIAAIHIPQYSRYRGTQIHERLNWSTAFDKPIALLGLPETELFRNMTLEQIQQLYYNEHLNRNGSRYFTESITPALIDLFLNRGTSHEKNLGLVAPAAVGSRG